jgi:hypothetical protein
LLSLTTWDKEDTVDKAVVCKTQKQLKKALSDKADVIRVEDADLVKKIKLIKLLKPATWVSVGGGLVVIIGALIVAAHPPEPGDIVLTPIKAGVRFGGGTVAAVATAVLLVKVGVATGTALVTLGFTFGGIGLLNALYNNYEIAERGDNYLVLKLK